MYDPNVFICHFCQINQNCKSKENIKWNCKLLNISVYYEECEVTLFLWTWTKIIRKIKNLVYNSIIDVQRSTYMVSWAQTNYLQI